ncbi:hypothetical protein VP01_1647g1, partial [Puccinia sorghi]
LHMRWNPFQWKSSCVFFRSSNVQSLLDFGFMIGVACLLCEGIPTGSNMCLD